jgi:phosphatidylserine/phosphatidylglycerophosphate/cardiolipin synthase-like enzyme
MRARTVGLAGLLALAGLSACDTDDPRPSSLESANLAPVDGESSFFEQVAVLQVGPAGPLTPADLEAQVVTLIGGATTEIVGAFERFESEIIAEALVAAQDRGVIVRLAGDEDARQQAGFVALAEGDVAVTFGDGPQMWSPQPGMDVRRLGSQNRMTHSVIIADGLRMIAINGGFGDPEAEDGRWQLGFSALGETLVDDWRHGIEQLVAGTFSTTLTVFGASTSADGNNRTSYPTEDGVVEGYIGPSEPLTKHIIDEIYAARASVWVASATMSNNEIINALRYKAEAGFDVKVIISPEAASEAYAFEQGDTQRVGMVPELRAAFEGLDNASLIEKVGPTGTVVITDAARSPIDRQFHGGQAFIMSQSLAPTVAFDRHEFRDGTLPGLPSDVFTDGNMLVLRENRVREAASDFDAAVQWYKSLSEYNP